MNKFCYKRDSWELSSHKPLKANWSHREQHLWRPAQEEGINPLSAGGEAGKSKVLNKWVSVCLKGLTAVLFSSACFPCQPRPLNTQAQGECTKRLGCLCRGCRVEGLEHRSARAERSIPLCPAFCKAGTPLSETALFPYQGLLSELHLIVVSELWLGSCRRYSCNRQACSSATYLFKWVQKFSASWRLFFPPLFYTNQLIC